MVWRGRLCRDKAVQRLPTDTDVIDAGVPCVILLLLLHSAEELNLHANKRAITTLKHRSSLLDTPADSNLPRWLGSPGPQPKN